MEQRNTRELIARYLEGETLDEADLPPAERAQLARLEEAYLEDAELLEELMLRQGLKDLDAKGELDKYMAPPPVASFDAHRNKRGWLRVLTSPQYAAAASIAFAACLVLSALLYVDNRALRTGIFADSPIATFDQLITVRGGESPNELRQPTANEIRNVLVDVSFEPYDSYRATVARLDAGGRTVIYDQAGLTPFVYDSVAVPLPGPSLVPGQYEIELTGRMDDWTADRPFAPVITMQFTVVAAQ